MTVFVPLLQNKNKDEAARFLPKDLPQQKNKKRCWTCKNKLEPAQRALGGCKCGKGRALVIAVRSATHFVPPFPLSSLMS